MEKNSKIYFPGLNGIRAIAAVIVLIFHIDLSASLFGLSPLGIFSNGMAGYGVLLFFVLSGYLITYLLMAEKEKFQSVSLRKFYIRRILRIWPIYYLVILITIIIILLIPGFLPQSENNLFNTLALYSFFLPNIGFALNYIIPTISPLWSVGVEEQFYAFWPILVNKIQNVLYALLGVIVVYLLIKGGFRYFENGIVYSLVYKTSFDCMAIGGLGAYLAYTKSKYLHILYHPFIQAVAWFVLLSSIVYKPLHLFSFLDMEINAIFYVIIILNVSTNIKTIINLEYHVFDYIGKISYGIYVFHMTILFFISFIIKHVLQLKFAGTFTDYFVVYSTCILSTIMVARFSYNHFESFFLRFKNGFSKILSTNASNF